MKIKMSLPKTKMLEEAKDSKSHNIVVEILIFIGVFIVGTILEALVVIVPEYTYLFNSPDYIQAMQDFQDGLIDTVQLEQRVTEITMNLPSYITVISLFATIMATIAVFVYCKRFEKRKLSTLGFRKNKALPEYLVGMLVGTVMFSVAVGICLAVGALRFDGICANISWGYIGLFFLGFLIQGMEEEVVCRGYLTVSLTRRIPVAVSIAITSIIFACMHLGNPGISVLAFVNLTLFGVFASVYMLKRGNIWGACAIHSLWNFVQGNFYGISVSGMEDMDSIMKMTSVSGKELFNGGAFGLEGGLGVTIVLVIGIVAVLCTKTKEFELAEENTADLSTTTEVIA